MAFRGSRILKSFRRAGQSLGAKLIVLLLVVLLASFALLGYLNIRLHRKHLESAAMVSAERVSDVIKRSTSYYMMRNDREGLYHIIRTMADEPGMVRIRIFNEEGRIGFSTDPAEVNTYVDKQAEACYACHAQETPLERLPRPDRLRIYTSSNGQRVLGIITPIENQPSCSHAACHAHPADKKILGVCDTNLSLAASDASLAESTRVMLLQISLAVLVISVLSGVFVWRFVHIPIQALRSGTERLAGGELGHQIEIRSDDEAGELAQSFNSMSRELHMAHEELKSWNRSLEERVAEKTVELKRAHEHAIHVERMASVGKLAAIVAHEINNPLAGILTYAKLLKRRLAAAQMESSKHEETARWLDLVESESRRCGEIVRNLLVFARAAPLNFEWMDPSVVVSRCLRLIEHQISLSGIRLELDLAQDLPRARWDASQIEQVLVALVINAIEAMPSGGTLRIFCGCSPAEEAIELRIEDSGIGIPPEQIERIFEPFFTTKEAIRGTGLGLAVGHGIVTRHGGTITVESRPGIGTKFTVRLPIDPDSSPPARQGILSDVIPSR